MRRRQFITLLGGTVGAAWPVVAWAQQAVKQPIVGILIGSVDNPVMRLRVAAFRHELQALGWTEGRDVNIELRWGGANPAAQARELVQLKPDVIVAGPTSAFLPVQKETRTIPIVFVSVSDPLGQGFVQSLSRPTGNATGFSNLEFSLVGKWLQVLKEAVPNIKRVGLMVSTTNLSSPSWYRKFREVAPAFAIEPVALPLSDSAALESTMRPLFAAPDSALIVPGDSVVETPSARRRIIELTARHRVPALAGMLAFAAEGGLITYGIDGDDPYRRSASYVVRILKGEKPSDLPVQAPTKFHFVINLKAAKTLGLAMSPTFVGTADEVIE